MALQVLSRYPRLRDALVWSVPALIAGGLLRIVQLWLMPYAFWGSDSLSYFVFAYDLFEKGDWNFDEKRRWIGPLLMAANYHLPGGALRWVAWGQHLLGWMAVVPFAFVVRCAFPHWRWLVIPATLLFTLCPALFVLEHQVIGDSLVVQTLVWAMAGWCAWITRLHHAPRAWLWIVPVAILLLTKPAMKALLPGLALGLLFTGAWRRMRWHQAAALALAIAATQTMGGERQAPFRIYFSLFPMTRLDTELHRDYKEEARDLIVRHRAHLDTYYAVMMDGSSYKDFVRLLQRDKPRPLWARLDEKGHEAEMIRVFRDLSREAMWHAPHLWLYTAWTRILAAANTGYAADLNVLDGSYYAARSTEILSRLAESKRRVLVYSLIGLDRSEPLPDSEALRERLWSGVGTPAAGMLATTLDRWGELWRLIDPPGAARAGIPAGHYVFSWWGWVTLVGLLLAALPRYRPTLGVWALTSVGYLTAVCLVGTVAARYFAPALPALILSALVPLDLLCSLAWRRAAPSCDKID